MSVGNDAPVDVHVHVHRVVTGTLPLRVADLLFTGRELLITEYADLTPVGLARGGVAAAGERARERYRAGGVHGLVALADRTTAVDYDDVERVRVHKSRVARPKVAVDISEGIPYAYRVHAPVDVDAMAGALRSLGDRRGFATDRQATLGFSPLNSLRRFFGDR